MSTLPSFFFMRMSRAFARGPTRYTRRGAATSRFMRLEPALSHFAPDAPTRARIDVAGERRHLAHCASVLAFVDEKAQQIFKGPVEQPRPLIRVVRVHGSVPLPTSNAVTSDRETRRVVAQDRGD